MRFSHRVHRVPLLAPSRHAHRQHKLRIIPPRNLAAGCRQSENKKSKRGGTEQINDKKLMDRFSVRSPCNPVHKFFYKYFSIDLLGTNIKGCVCIPSLFVSSQILTITRDQTAFQTVRRFIF